MRPLRGRDLGRVEQPTVYRERLCIPCGMPLVPSDQVEVVMTKEQLDELEKTRGEDD